MTRSAREKRLKFLEKEQSLDIIVIGTIGEKNAVKIFEKKHSLESLAFGTIGAKNAIETLKDGTKSRMPSDWREKCD